MRRFRPFRACTCRLTTTNGPTSQFPACCGGRRHPRTNPQLRANDSSHLLRTTWCVFPLKCAGIWTYSATPPDEQRTLVFDYLCRSSYTNTARAFLKNTVVKDPGENGDDAMAMDVDDGALDAPLDPTVVEKLRLAELRRGASHICMPLQRCMKSYLLYRDPNPDTVWERRRGHQTTRSVLPCRVVSSCTSPVQLDTFKRNLYVQITSVCRPNTSPA